LRSIIKQKIRIKPKLHEFNRNNPGGRSRNEPGNERLFLESRDAAHAPSGSIREFGLIRIFLLIRVASRGPT
jgi:hypothetical protein